MSAKNFKMKRRWASRRAGAGSPLWCSMSPIGRTPAC